MTLILVMHDGKIFRINANPNQSPFWEQVGMKRAMNADQIIEIRPDGRGIFLKNRNPFSGEMSKEDLVMLILRAEIL